MAEAEDTSLGSALDYARAIKRIHKILDGVEWSAGTIEEVAQVIADVGLEIRGPEDMPSLWGLKAIMEIHMVGTEIEEVVVLPNLDANFSMQLTLLSGNADTNTEEDVQEALSRYIAITEHTRKGKSAHSIRWKD